MLPLCNPPSCFLVVVFSCGYSSLYLFSLNVPSPICFQKVKCQISWHVKREHEMSCDGRHDQWILKYIFLINGVWPPLSPPDFPYFVFLSLLSYLWVYQSFCDNTVDDIPHMSYYGYTFCSKRPVHKTRAYQVTVKDLTQWLKVM